MMGSAQGQLLSVSVYRHWVDSHLKRIGVKTPAQCPCEEADQTPEHYLQSCSIHQQARQQIWSTCVSLKIKLWGSAEDSFLTSKYAARTGEEDLVNATITSNAEEELDEIESWICNFCLLLRSQPC